MDLNLNHLPPHKQQELARVAQTIVHGCAGVGLVLLFGSYARGDWKEEGDLAPNRKSGHASDYDILVVTDDDEDCDPHTWLDIARACDGAGISTHVRIIHHERGHILRQLTKGQYFYSEIVTQGKVLYRAEGFDLPEPSTPNREQQLESAQDGFGHWFEKARRFRQKAEFSRSNGWLPDSAFDLHQATEAAYKAVLIVFTGYIPNEHYLDLLGRQAAEVDARLADIFPREEGFKKDAFELLDYAYIGARYDPQYHIDEPTLLYLADRVAHLLERVESACRERIEVLKKTA